MRREFSNWIAIAKTYHARMKRSEQIAECPVASMEGELHLDSMIGVAFCNRPEANLGWQ
jgi:hypothetical protein